MVFLFFFFFQAEDGIRDGHVTGVQTCALPILVISVLPVPVAIVTSIFRLRSRIACSTRSEEHTSELQSRGHLVCRLLLEKKKKLPHPILFLKKKKKKNI